MSGQIHRVKNGFHEIAISFDLTELFPSPERATYHSNGCSPLLKWRHVIAMGESTAKS